VLPAESDQLALIVAAVTGLLTHEVNDQKDQGNEDATRRNQDGPLCSKVHTATLVVSSRY
jgi:hypothetical protein